jgi:hypothetical protein
MRPLIFVAEANLSEGNCTFHLDQFHRTSTISNIGLNSEQLHGPHEPGIALLPEPDEIGQPIHRIDQHRHAQQESQEVRHPQIGRQHANGADDDHHDRHQLREGRRANPEERLAAIAILAALEEQVVGAVEAIHLQRFIGEGLDDANARQRILHPLIDPGDTLLAPLHRNVHAAVEMERIDHRKRRQQPR